MEATLANAITSTTTGPYVAVQPIGGTDPVIVEVYGKSLGTSGAYSITVELQGSEDASTFTAISTHVLTGTAQSKPFAVQVKVPVPFLRAEVTAISGTGASLSLRCRPL
jgi:hypothetical protein